MARDSEEQERPAEWLRALREGRRSYGWLVEDSGGLVVAAYRLARARGRTGEVANAIPTVAELCAALDTLRRSAAAGVEVPSRAVLIEECEAHSLPLIAPVTRRAA
jgi:hypothetical protein